MNHTAPGLPEALYTAAEVRALDEIAINHYRITGAELMERAGRTAFETLRSVWPDARRITVICGSGNNGGDGFVLARLAHTGGMAVTVLQAGPCKRGTGAAADAAAKLAQCGLHPRQIQAGDLDSVDLVVDALFGTGLDRDVAGAARSVIEQVNRSRIPVLALDIPSGLNADTGSIMGSTIRAAATITFIGLKRGLFTGQGPGCVGQLFFNDLQVPHEITMKINSTTGRIDFEHQKQLLPRRDRSAHKGNFGHVLVIGGEPGYAGAVRMAAEAAGRTGAGLVSVATRQQHAALISMARPEIMAYSVESSADLSPLLDRATVVAIGPGLGQSAWSSQLFARILETSLPLVVDADALNLLAQEPAKNDNWILTPHPGEAGRLLGCPASAVQQDRFAAAKELQHRYGGIIVLKGSGTLVCGGTGQIDVCSDGNPGMASGGMGDVLTGVIAGLLAQSLDLADAARCGVCLHAAAADAAAREGERGMLAMDLMPWIRKLVNPA